MSVAGVRLGQMEDRRSSAAVKIGSPLPDRRSEPRKLSHEEVLVKVPGWAGQPNPMRARIINISGQGMCLLTQHPVQCGIHVEIKTARGVVVGEVCRCRHEDAGYSLGVRIKPEAA